MELSVSVFTDVLSPLAAFLPAGDAEPAAPAAEKLPSEYDPWPTSWLNPKNRIDSLAPAERPTWRIDGAHLDGQRFFAVPTFALGRPPLRVDLHLAPSEEWPRPLRDVLMPEAALYARRSTIPSLPLSQYLVRALDHWASCIPDFQEAYLSLPFGSRILVAHVAAHLDETEIHLIPVYEVEQELLGISFLIGQWGDRIFGAGVPGMLDWANLAFVRQIAETISLVHIPSLHGDAEFVFKSLTRDTRHMYHELKVLLSLEAHPNIISHPLYVVEKRCRFGGRKSVCGFILEYFPLGTLQDRLSSPVPASLSQRVRWGKQVAEALVHVASQRGEGWFYPDLKPDNIMLRPSERNGRETDAVLLDFEQRGGWFGWSPPEVLCVEYMEILASSLPRGAARKEARDLLLAHIPNWRRQPREAEYRDAVGGFGQAWLALSQRDTGAGLDRAQVFLLGKLLWCIFEGQPTVRCGMDHELLRDVDPAGPAFPEFRRTPQDIRSLIRRCTMGARAWQGARRAVAVIAGRLVLYPGGHEEEGKELTATEVVRETSRRWWREEVAAAKDTLRQLVTRRPGYPSSEESQIRGLISQRPRLVDVLEELRRIEATGVAGPGHWGGTM